MKIDGSRAIVLWLVSSFLATTALAFVWAFLEVVNFMLYIFWCATNFSWQTWLIVFLLSFFFVWGVALLTKPVKLKDE